MSKRRFKRVRPNPIPELFANTNIKVKICILLTPKELSRLEIAAKAIDLSLVWKEKCLIDFQYSFNYLPLSYASYKVLYGTLAHIHDGIYTFSSFSCNGLIPQQNYHLFKPRLSKYLTMNPILDHPHVSATTPVASRYICAISCEPLYNDLYCLFDNSLYFVEKSTGFQKIYGRNLLDRKSALLQASTRRKPIRLLKSSGSGMLVSLSTDNDICVWTLNPLQIKNEIVAERQVISLDAKNDILAILFRDGLISVFDLKSGRLISHTSVPTIHYEPFKFSLNWNITVTKNFIGVGYSKGQYLVFIRDKFGLYSFQHSFPDMSINRAIQGFSSTPRTFRILHNFIVTNSVESDELQVYRMMPCAPSPTVNLFRSKRIGALSNESNPVISIEKRYDLSERTAIRAYGFQSLVIKSDLVVGYWDEDGSMIAGFLEEEESHRLVVFDFRVDKPKDRHFERILLGEEQLWLVFE